MIALMMLVAAAEPLGDPEVVLRLDPRVVPKGAPLEVRGIFVRLGEASFDLSESEELSRLLGKVVSKGKPVVCHANTLGRLSDSERDTQLVAAMKVSSRLHVTQ